MPTSRILIILLLGTNGLLLVFHMIFLRNNIRHLPSITPRRTFNNLKVHGMDYEQIMKKYPFLKQGNETKRRYPDAIIIGVRKGGTATLRSFLAKHPLVAIVEREGHFFDCTNYEKGFKYYRSLMPISKPGQTTIEKTPSYMRKTLVPERIRFFNPKIKLIVLLREPVSRLISDYVHNSLHPGRLESQRPFERVFFYPTGEVIDTHRVTMRGIYVDQLRKWFENFHHSQFLILDTAELIHNPYQALHETECFLGLPEYFTKENFFFDEDKRFFCYKDANGPACLPNTKGRAHPNIPEKAIQKLKKFYEPYNKQLVDFLGRNFSWTV